MKSWTIRHSIVASIAGVLFIIAAVGGLSLNELRSIGIASAALQSDSLPGLQNSTELEAIWLANHSVAESYALSADAAARSQAAAELRSGAAQIDALLKQYDATIFSEQNRAVFERFKSAYTEYLATQGLLIAATTTSNPEAVRTQLAQQYRQVRSALAALVRFDQLNAEQSAQNISRGVTAARWIIIISLVCALLLAGTSGLLLLRAITRPLAQLLGSTDRVSRGDFTQRIDLARRDEFGALAGAFDRMVAELNDLIAQVQKSAIQVGTSITEIVATANEQQATATEVSATTTQIGATSKEISATSKELVGTMHEVSAVAEQTASLASNGQAGLARMETTMRQVTDAAASINAKLVTLNEKASNINQVVTTITKVADQTNLLSLNAAIEAEKAGEAGRGFAVVATEIRRLADQTSVATYDIEQTVKEIQSAVAASVMGMDKFSEEVRRGMQDVQQVGEHLSQIIHQVQALAPRCIAASEGMQAQSTGAEQISDALAQLTEASQQTVESLRQSNDAIGGLNGVASALRNAIARFKLRAAPQESMA